MQVDSKSENQLEGTTDITQVKIECKCITPQLLSHGNTRLATCKVLIAIKCSIPFVSSFAANN